MTASPEIRNASSDDLVEIQALLQRAALPSEDMASADMQHFVIVRDAHGILVGSGGIEHYGKDGLLRSIIVHENARGTGLGKRITMAVEQRARENGVMALYLLTTTAADFFPRLGYAPFERDAVPESLKKSAEFASLCPASAVCMKKDLE